MFIGHLIDLIDHMLTVAHLFEYFVRGQVPLLLSELFIFEKK